MLSFSSDGLDDERFLLDDDSAEMSLSSLEALVAGESGKHCEQDKGKICEQMMEVGPWTSQKWVKDSYTHASISG